jgi:DNA helicase II / ATP-dependent DNA helicase PcrA
VTATTDHHTTREARELATPEELQRFMGADYPLSDEQFAAVTAPLEPTVVVAGAGSGKTTLMAARVVWLVGTGRVRPEEILGLTFTTKAAAELATRVRDTLTAAGVLRAPGARTGDELDEVLEPTVSTYHAYAASLLTDHGLRIGHEPDTRVVADASRFQLAARVVARHAAPVTSLSDHPQTVIGWMLALDAAMSEHLVDPAEVVAVHERWAPRVEELCAQEARTTYTQDAVKCRDRFTQREELLGLVREYRALKQGLGLMEFSDQIELAARLAQECPEVGELERGRFKVVLLDEYQDTSVAQALMLSRLFSGPDEAHGRGHPVTAVGDPNQAIYGWRGASVSNIIRFGESFPPADGAGEVRRHALTINRRSGSRILDLANRMVAAMPEPLTPVDLGVQDLCAPESAVPGELHAEVFEHDELELEWLATEVAAARARPRPDGSERSWRDVAVLTRDNKYAARVFAALSQAEVPVEIVGLNGLLALPEVSEVVATLTLLHDLSDNASMLTLLTSPRWAIGPRDLALLGARAHDLSGSRGPERSRDRPVEEELTDAVAGSDATEIPALADALDNPGEAAYSPEARERFAELAGELRRLRQHAGDPLLDLVRRIIDTSGLDVELASSVSPAAVARRDNLDLFVKAVAEFQAVDGDVSLPALLSYLSAETDDGTGLDQATPTEADSVKLLTVHRSKGLEWDVVFVVGVATKKFPAGRVRPAWTTTAPALPFELRGDAADLPQLAGVTKADFAAFNQQRRDYEAAEEARLAYVAFTRPRHELWVSSYVWGTTKTPHGPSEYQRCVREQLEDEVARGVVAGPLPAWPDLPEKGTSHPFAARGVEEPWPRSTHTAETARRHDAAALVRRAQADLREGRGDDPLLDVVELAEVETWDTEIDRLVEEARSRRVDEVRLALPSALSATALASLRADPEGFAAGLARPMPRPPSPAARFGTRFHAWVESYLGAVRQELLVDLDELGGRADQGVDGEADLAALVDAFRRGRFGERRASEVEAPFALVLAGQVVRGRIDAVFEEPDGSVLVVDWKTSRAHTADPVQLAVYRVAWAELHGIPLDRVRAGFYYVRDDDLVEPTPLADRDALEALLDGSR